MQFNTEFSCGDKAWVYRGDACRLTIGQVQVTAVDSPGDGDSMFDNYKPQSKYEEWYMCVETGIGSGSCYQLGKHIFRTKDECIAANAEAIAQQARAKAEAEAYENRLLLAREAEIRRELARIESLKVMQL
jgi:hypothetical protein